jgi:hypothetical protein
VLHLKIRIRSGINDYRRAKIKLLAKKSIETGEDCDTIPESMRQYLAMQDMESGKTLGGNFMGRSGIAPYGNGAMLLGGDQGPQGKVGMCLPHQRKGSLHGSGPRRASGASLTLALSRWKCLRCTNSFIQLFTTCLVDH